MNWFRRSKSSRKKSRKSPGGGLLGRAGHGRLAFESLEHRRVLATLTWTGATDGNWSTATNWSTSAMPSNNDALVFPAGASHLANTDDLAGLTVSSLSFSGTSGGYTLAGADPLTVSSGISASNTAGTNTISLPLVLGGSQSFTVASGAQLDISGIIGGTPALTKDGLGTLDLSATNTYAGGTTVVDGTLLVDGTIGSVIVSGGTLGGIGTTGTITATNGSISPGNGPGVLHSASVTMNSSTTYKVDINGTTPGNSNGDYDQLNVTGTVNLGGAALDATPGFTPALGNSFDIIQATGAISGTLAEGNSVILNGQKFLISYNTNTVMLTAVKADATTVVNASPSPGTFGQPVTLTATVTGETGANGTPSGTVNFYDGATLIGPATLSTVSGQQQAVISTSALAMGPHSITAVYVGDGSFNGGTSPAITETISAAASTTTLSSSATAITAGSSITLTATVAAATGVGTPTGTVNFLDDGAVVGSAPLTTVAGRQQAVLTTTSLPIGNRSITAQYAGDANFAGSGSTALLEYVGNTTQRYVDQVYRDLLKRDAEAQAQTYWTTALGSGLTRLQFTDTVAASPEYRTIEIQNIFSRYLGRPADPASLASFSQFMAQGGTLETATAILIGSQEYYSKHGGTGTNFADAMYRDLLGRPVDSAALASISAELSAGIARSTIAAQVMSTTEYRDDLVEADYTQFLGRSADASAVVVARGLSDEQLVAILVASDEYFNRIGP
jgi:trimeric autotransporter adhesin